MQPLNTMYQYLNWESKITRKCITRVSLRLSDWLLLAVELRLINMALLVLWDATHYKSHYCLLHALHSWHTKLYKIHIKINHLCFITEQSPLRGSKLIFLFSVCRLPWCWCSSSPSSCIVPSWPSSSTTLMTVSSASLWVQHRGGISWWPQQPLPLLSPSRKCVLYGHCVCGLYIQYLAVSFPFSFLRPWHEL